jgi:hypothetical protein
MLAEQEQKNLETELALDIAQLTLDLIGIVEPTPFADTASGIISVYRGDWMGAGLSMLGWIPYLGDLAKVGKLPKLVETVTRAVRLSAEDARFARAVAPRLLKLRSLLAKLTIASLPKAIRPSIEALSQALETFAARYRRVAEKAPSRVAAGRYTFRLLDDLEVDSFLKLLGKSNAPVLVRERVALAGGFLMHHFKSASSALDYLKGIDLSKPVKVVPLEAGQIITQHWSAKLGNWFSKSGVSTYELGISEGTRQLKRFAVKAESFVLESRAAATADSWTQGRRLDRWVPGRNGATGEIEGKAAEYVTGGGIQYVFPNAVEAVREILR